MVDLRIAADGGTPGATVSVAAPAVPVPLPSGVARRGLAARSAAALDNVARHCGGSARAWVLVEDEPAAVTVTVRDDGPGIAEGPAGRGRASRGGSAWRSRSGAGSPTSAAPSRSPPTPGEGTEVELRVPR